MLLSFEWFWLIVGGSWLHYHVSQFIRILVYKSKHAIFTDASFASTNYAIAHLHPIVLVRESKQYIAHPKQSNIDRMHKKFMPYPKGLDDVFCTFNVQNIVVHQYCVPLFFHIKKPSFALSISQLSAWKDILYSL